MESNKNDSNHRQEDGRNQIKIKQDEPSKHRMHVSTMELLLYEKRGTEVNNILELL